MALDGLARASEEDMVLALKALGNAGHPASIKTILRFLPAVAANPVALPARVQSAAVQALRLIAARDPQKVRADPPPPPLSTFCIVDMIIDMIIGMIIQVFNGNPCSARVTY